MPDASSHSFNASKRPVLDLAEFPELDAAMAQSWMAQSQTAIPAFHANSRKELALPTMKVEQDLDLPQVSMYGDWIEQTTSPNEQASLATPWALPDDQHREASAPIQLEYTKGPEGAVTNSSVNLTPVRMLHIAPRPSPPPEQISDPWWPSSDLLLPGQSHLPGLDSIQFDQPSMTAEAFSYSQSNEGESQSFRSEALDAASRKQHYLQLAHQKWGNVGSRNVHARQTALLEMKSWGLSYKEIQSIGNYSDALPTLRGRYRTLTRPASERVRNPSWEPRDVSQQYSCLLFIRKAR